MKKITAIFLFLITSFNGLADPKQLTCMSPNALEDRNKYMASMAEYAKENPDFFEPTVEACKLVKYKERHTFIFDTDELNSSKESAAESVHEVQCATKVKKQTAKMTSTPSIITFKLESVYTSGRYYNYNVNRKTLEAGEDGHVGRHVCTLEDVDTSDNIL
tara:strand:- start:169 stop:651 length:483 start_codon:yes stop_codon:yes gene_type:complete